jgi:hypothetical protein
MRYFCTYFDQGYLSRGLALYRSLRRHCPDARLWVLCMDEASYSDLARLALPGLELIAIEEFERGDAELLRAKASRSRVEYYFTCTPSLPLYILGRWPEVDLITYLDADLYFFADPQPVFDELGPGSVAVIPHRFVRRVRQLTKLGRYNVGWVSFRRDESGLACLRWWRERCNEWCYDRYDGRRFADQKYLDEWPRRFSGVVEITHKGANLAPWNIAGYQIRAGEAGVWADADPLIFYHFHAFRQPRGWLYDHQLHLYGVRPTGKVLQYIYVPYIHALAAAGQRALAARALGIMARFFGLIDLAVGLLTRRYIVSRRGRLLYFERLLRPTDLGAAPILEEDRHALRLP